MLASRDSRSLNTCPYRHANTYAAGTDYNGNLTTLTDLSNGSIVAAYEYSAFGEILRETGSFASDNPFRFATHFTDKESGLVYYGQRYYHPSMGRFINSDPIGEAGGSNLYGFVGNNPVNSWDYLGLVNLEPGVTPNDRPVKPLGPIFWPSDEDEMDDWEDRQERRLRDFLEDLEEWLEDNEEPDPTPPVDQDTIDAEIARNNLTPEARDDLKQRAGELIDEDAEFHYSGNTENDQFAKKYGLYGRNDITMEEIRRAGRHGMKRASATESQYHRQGKGNENNIKYTSKVAINENWWQRNWTNRYGRNELIFRPNPDGKTYTHVIDPINMGTLNRGNDPISHVIWNINTYKKYGNTPN